MSMSNGFQSPASPDPGPDMRSLAEGLMLAGLQIGLYAEWEAEETVELERRGWGTLVSNSSRRPSPRLSAFRSPPPLA